MKKVRVFFYMDAQQKKRLEELSRNTQVLLSEYLRKAVDDILDRYESAEDKSAGAVSEEAETVVIDLKPRQAQIGGG